MTMLFEQVLADAEQLAPAERIRLAVHLLGQMQEMVPLSVPKQAQQNLQARRAFVDSVCGKYAYVQTSSEEFANRKQADIDWENRHYESRA